MPAFGSPAAVSDAANNAFIPAVAARADQCLLVWHEFPPSASASQVSFALVQGGVVGAPQVVSDPFAGPKDPWVATTKLGYVVAYQANDGQADVIRAVEIDDTGAVVAGPDTISTPGVEATTPRVATNGDEEIFAWTDGTRHSFAMRGPKETVAASPVGTTLLAQGILNFPRVAIDDSGRVFLAYRDGGSDAAAWEVLLVVRPHGGAFGAPVDVSKSPGLLSDDIALALEPDGTLDLAWVDQDSVDINAFEVVHTTRAPSGQIGAPTDYGKQGLWSWTPSVVPGQASVWDTGGQGSGPLWYGAPGLAPTAILDGAQGGHPVMARGPDGVLHLVYADVEMPARIQYAEAPAP